MQVEKGEGMKNLQRAQFAEIWQTGLPIFAELFLVSLFVMVDTALLKPCGTVAIAAVGLTVEPVNVLEFAFFAVQTAVIALMARASAKGENGQIAALIRGYFKLVMVSATVIAVVTCFAARPYLALFGATEDTFSIAVPYFRITLLAFVCRRMSGAMTAVLKGLGHPRWSFTLNLLANAVNIVGDVLLINGYGPFPCMGAVGAAVATAIGCAVGLAGACIVLARRLPASGIALPAADWRRSSRAEVRTICAEALPMVGEKVMIRFGIFLCLIKIAALGTTAFATYRILISLQNFAYLGAEAISTTALIFLSRGYATRNKEQARIYFTVNLVYALGFSGLCALLFFVLPEPLMGLYSDDPMVIAAGVGVLRFICFYQPFQAVALLYAGGMRSCKQAAIPSAVTTLGIVVIRPALIYILIGAHGVNGAWIAIMTDEITRCVLLLALRGRMWRQFDAGEGIRVQNA